MSIKYGWLLLQLRPRVIHRLPGRLRIHIPALKKVNDHFHEIATILLKGFSLPDHVESVEVNYTTGNILVVFNPEMLAERQVLEWIFDIKAIVESIFLKFVNMPDNEIKTAQLKLLHFMKSASKNGSRIDSKFTIPNEIWH